MLRREIYCVKPSNGLSLGIRSDLSSCTCQLESRPPHPLVAREIIWGGKHLCYKTSLSGDELTLTMKVYAKGKVNLYVYFTCSIFF